MKSDAKVFAKRNIDRVGGFDRARQLNRECSLHANEQSRDDVVFTFERKRPSVQARTAIADLRISTALNSRKHGIDLTIRFSANICQTLGLKAGDTVRAQGSPNGIWYIDLTKPTMGNALVASRSKAGGMYVRFATDTAEVAAIGLGRFGDDIPAIDCEFVEADDCTAVFCRRD